MKETKKIHYFGIMALFRCLMKQKISLARSGPVLFN